uniref:Thaumatin-like protein n=1 Tax=Drosera adelae TaxID=173387 RepID=A0A6J4DIH9_9CARY|nr:thaumatin-like protein [Drosera adelae]
MSNLIISFFLFSILFSVSTNAATFTITNNCPYTIWAAAVPGGGKQLNSGGTWTITAPGGTTGARIWGRTGCTVTGPNGLRCNTGDCGGLFQCQGYGQPPNTLAEYALNQFDNLDFFDISLVDGFNVPMQFVPVSGGCTSGPICSANIIAQCPSVLQTQGGCNNPCTVFKTPEYCCTSGSCGPTQYSEFFKGLCPNAYSYPKDDATSTYTCKTGANYKVVFCP